MTQETVIGKSECLTMKDIFLKREDFVRFFEKRTVKSFFTHNISCSIMYYSWAS